MASSRLPSLVASLLVAMVVVAPAAAAREWCTIAVRQARAVLASGSFSLPDAKAAPHPLADMHSGGMPHQGRWDEVHAAAQDWVLMERAALAWRAGGDEAQYAVATRLLTAWADTYKPTLNAIDETEFDMVIETFAIVRDRLPPKDRTRIASWLDSWGWAYVESIKRFGRPDYSVWINNWQSHRIKLIVMMAASTDDKTLFAEGRRLFRLQIAANMHADGETLDFAVRDALHYTVYDLEPLVQAALVARRFSGEDWYHWETADHASLARAVAWLTPYASGARTHEEFVHSQVDFDAERAAAGVKGYKGLFDPHDAAGLYWQASRFEPSLAPLAKSLGEEPAYLTMCGS